MPLHGKIVVIKRSGGDGTEFPLVASCLFGRKTDCDIRIQLPQVSKEHCRIDLNENKEVIVTNLSTANPTSINGKALQQSERLKHGDVITIIDRSFRFEYPPAPTPKKRSSSGGKSETLKVRQGSTTTSETADRRISQASTDPHLKDGTNNDNIQRSLEKTMEMESKEDDGLLQSKTTSPFSDLYQMIKKSLDVKTPRKSSASQLQTPSSKFCTPKPQSVRKSEGTPVTSTGSKSTPNKDAARISPRAAEAKKAETPGCGTPQSVKKQRKSLQIPATAAGVPDVEGASPQTRRHTTPQKFTVSEVVEQITAQKPKTPMRRRSQEATPTKPAVNMEQEQAVTSAKTQPTRKTTPRSSEKVKEMPKKRKSGELPADLPVQQMKRKRVSFGGHLSPELFDKRLPPDSPLRKGATPRRSLCLSKPKQSLLRRASVIGLLKHGQGQARMRTPSPKKSSSAKSASPKTAKSRSPSPKPSSPGKVSASPKAVSPGKKSPASKAASPKAVSPGKKSPASKAASPNAVSPGKKSPASKAASPNAVSPGKKSPAFKAASPKAVSPGKKSPASKSASPKAPSQAKKSPTSKTASPRTPKAYDESKPQRKSTTSRVKRRSSPNLEEKTPITNRSPAKTPINTAVQTPTVQGRFSVSRISTPSPTAEDTLAELGPAATVTPKIPLKRKSMKSSSKKTPRVVKSAVKVMRTSGLSRVSMKAMNSWADIVKFGQKKVQVVAPAKKIVTKNPAKKVPRKPPTPARRLKDHVGTGHADSPATIVVGRAQQRVVHPTGAAPKVVLNTALSRKNIKMDEDLTGISEMFKTPVNDKRRRSVNGEIVAPKTPVADLGKSTMEPSMLNTPEEPGQMMVSPLTESAIKLTGYNSEAVQRLLNAEEEASFVGDSPPMEIQCDDSSEQQLTDAPTTPNQKQELPECLTGVKRIMKTPKQEAEPVEDMREKRLKTPNQKPEQKECLTGVKRIMKTPKQKQEPVEDMRGKIFKTPKQKPEQQECLSGVKRMMKTPREKPVPVEDIRGKLLKTPKEKPQQQECLSGVKRIMKTPKQKPEPIEDIRGNLLKTPKEKPEQQECLSGVKQIFKTPKWDDELEEKLDAKELLETPAGKQESDVQPDVTTEEPKVESSPSMLLSGIKRMIKTPKEKSGLLEDMVGVGRLMKTPREKGKPVEENLGLKRLMKSPWLRGAAPVEDFEGLEELMKEPLRTPAGQKTAEVEEEIPVDCGSAVVKELEFVHGDADVTKDVDENKAPDEDQSERIHIETKVLDAMDTVSESAVDKDSSKCLPEVEMDADEVVPSGSEQSATDAIETQAPAAESLSEVEATTCEITETAEAIIIIDAHKKSARGRRKKVDDSKAAAEANQEDEQSQEPVAPAPVRGRRGKKTEAPASAAVRPTRGRNAKTTEHKDDELTQEERVPVPAVKPKRGTNAKRASDEQAEIIQEVSSELVPDTENDQSEAVDAAPLKKRGRKVKQLSVPQVDVLKDASVAVPSGNDDNKMVATDTQAPVAENFPEVEMTTCKVVEAKVVDIPDAQKKSVRGRRTKLVESKATDEKQVDDSEEPVAPVRGRRGKKTEAPVAVRPTRGRTGKAQERNSEDAGDSHTDDASVAHVEEVTKKPKRGRATKQTSIEPPVPEPASSEIVSDQPVVEEAEPEQPAPAVENPKRGGRKTKPNVGKKTEVTEDTATPEETKSVPKPTARPKRGTNAKLEEEKSKDEEQTLPAETPKSQEPLEDKPVAEETKQLSQPPVRAKRGRNAKQEEEKPENNEQTISDETAKSSEPAKKVRRTRKAEQNPVEPSEDVQTAGTAAPEEITASVVAEPIEMIEQAALVSTSRRGGRKAQDPKGVTPAESTAVQEASVVSRTEKPKRGKRGKQSAEEAAGPEEKPTHEPEAEEKSDADSACTVNKPSRARRGKAVAKIDASEAIPAKRARRGATISVEENSTEVVPEPALVPVEPVKRGRRAATKANVDDTVSSDHVVSSEDSRTTVEDKRSKRSVKWKADCEIFEVTPLKTVRGRRLKSGDEKDTESNSVSKSATKTEEMDLSDQKPQPVKRARRGAKVTGVEFTNEDKDGAHTVEAETQPKTRRGRSAKK